MLFLITGAAHIAVAYAKTEGVLNFLADTEFHSRTETALCNVQHCSTIQLDATIRVPELPFLPTQKLKAFYLFLPLQNSTQNLACTFIPVICKKENKLYVPIIGGWVNEAQR